MFADASNARGIGGYPVDRRNGIGLLQHYGMPTSFIDFTGCLDVAIFFALHGASSGDEVVIYSLDRSRLVGNAICFELDFLCLPLSEGGIRHRHLRQDAFVVGPAYWMAADSHIGFNLYAEPYLDAVAMHSFVKQRGDVASIADVLSLNDDPIPHHLVNLVELWAEQRLSGQLDPDISGCMQEMLSYRGVV
jgi:hypothetical protein